MKCICSVVKASQPGLASLSSAAEFREMQRYLSMTAARDLDCDTLACDAGEEDLCGYFHRDSDFSQCFTIILARRFEYSSDSETAYTEIQRERFPKALAFPARIQIWPEKKNLEQRCITLAESDVVSQM